METTHVVETSTIVDETSHETGKKKNPLNHRVIVDNAEIGTLSREISKLEERRINLKRLIKDAKYKLAKGFTWTVPTVTDDTRKRIKVILSSTEIRNLRLWVDQFQRDLLDTEITLKKSRVEHTELVSHARRQAKLDRQVSDLEYRAEKDPTAFLKALESDIKELPSDYKAFLVRLPEKYRTDQVDAKKDLMRIIDSSLPGMYITLRKHPAIKDKLFSSFFGDTPATQDGSQA